MELDIRAGKRVLYKHSNSGWLVGVVNHQQADVNEKGVWIPIIPNEFLSLDPEDVPYVHYAEINNIFTEAVEIEDWMRPALMKKEEYVKLTEDENFDRLHEKAWVSDGEYIYYPITKFNKAWIEKQPFDYVVRSE